MRGDVSINGRNQQLASCSNVALFVDWAIIFELCLSAYMAMNDTTHEIHQSTWELLMLWNAHYFPAGYLELSVSNIYHGTNQLCSENVWWYISLTCKRKWNLMSETWTPPTASCIPLLNVHVSWMCSTQESQFQKKKVVQAASQTVWFKRPILTAVLSQPWLPHSERPSSSSLDLSLSSGPFPVWPAFTIDRPTAVEWTQTQCSSVTALSSRLPNLASSVYQCRLKITSMDFWTTLRPWSPQGRRPTTTPVLSSWGLQRPKSPDSPSAHGHTSATMTQPDSPPILCTLAAALSLRRCHI